jgi:predicted MPP superfamily phosphohydrolase
MMPKSDYTCGIENRQREISHISKKGVHLTRVSRGFSRRDFLRVLKRTFFSSVAAGTGSLVYGFYGEPGWVDVEQVELVLPRLPKSFSGFRLLQLSDIHLGGWMDRERLAHVVDIVNSQSVDLVVMTGDYVLGHGWTVGLDRVVDDLVTELSRLTSRHTVLAVLGNHDHWTKAENVSAMLSHCGAIELANDVHTFKRGEDQLHICGVDDIWEHKDRLDEVLGRLPESGAAILLAHEPDFADKSAATGRFDLQLSGHSHGGQVVIPILGAPVLPHLGERYPSGLYQVEDMWQYTNRGVGMINPAIRLNCRPEITIFTLLAP